VPLGAVLPTAAAPAADAVAAALLRTVHHPDSAPAASQGGATDASSGGGLTAEPPARAAPEAAVLVLNVSPVVASLNDETLVLALRVAAAASAALPPATPTSPVASAEAAQALWPPDTSAGAFFSRTPHAKSASLTKSQIKYLRNEPSLLVVGLHKECLPLPTLSLTQSRRCAPHRVDRRAALVGAAVRGGGDRTCGGTSRGGCEQQRQRRESK
jgi:hypothetical protein